MKTMLVMRRIHLYLALFLMPWILMYAVSGLIMHHRELIRELVGGEVYAVNTLEREMVYDTVFPEDSGPMLKAEQVLNDLGMSGRFNARERNDSGLLIINRMNLLKPRRIEYNPSYKSLKIYAGKAHPVPVLTRIHHRLGYGNGSGIDNIWAFFVDSVIGAIFFWSISGVLMWYGIRKTRVSGLILLSAGALVFIFCVLMI